MVASLLPQLSKRPWVEHYPEDVPAHLEYPAKPVFWLLEEAARRNPSRIACRFFQQEVTYEELLAQSHRLAAALRERGLKRGERVGILLPNTPEYLVSLFGVWMAGGITVPINPLMVSEEVAALLKSTSCRFVVSLDLLLPLLGKLDADGSPTVFVTTLKDRLPWWDRQLYKLARLHRLGVGGRHVPEGAIDFNEVLDSAPSSGFEPEHLTPDTPANIMPSGGTTGSPKAVLLTHGNLIANTWQVFHWNGKRVNEDVILAVLPFFHSYGLTTCALNGIAMNATLILHHRFRADIVLRLVERWHPTLVPAVPAMLVAFNKEMRRRTYDLGDIRAVISGGGPLSPDVAEEFAERSGAVVVEGYGLSEASPVTHTGPLDGTARPGTIGMPLPDTDAKIVDAVTGEGPLPFGEVGELVIRGPQVMPGYWNDPEATAQAIRDGWLFTGDLGTCDADGFFRIVDRKKDLIKTSGVNVFPTEVEHVLRECGEIDDIAVLGVPDERRGELVKAVVVPKDPKKFSRKAFDEFAKQHLEVHKRPRVVEIVRGPLPRTPLGKILRRALREQHVNGKPSEMNGDAPPVNGGAIPINGEAVPTNGDATPV